MDPLRVIPKAPQTQALSSKTFAPPLLDGTLTLPELYEWHLKNTPHHPLFIFPRSHEENRTILWPEAVRAIHTGVRFVRKIMEWKAGVVRDKPVIAILATSDTITYFTMAMAIMRAGYIVFPISPRNSPAAVAHLISKVNVRRVLVGHDSAMINLGQEAMKFLETQHPDISKPEFSQVPCFEDLFLDTQEDSQDDIPYEKPGQDDIAIYLHSSGSTAFPKPIPWTNFRFVQLALIPYFGERDLTGLVWSLHVMPMYHAMGLLQMCWTASCGLIVSAFEPKSPATLPTAQNHFEAALACNSDLIFCVPAIIEEWSRKPEYVKWLATRGGVLFGGGPLNKDVGDHLTSQGVSTLILYGSSEGGIMTPLIPADAGYDWEYFKFPGNITPRMVPQGNGTYEFVMVSNSFCEPSVINTEVNGIKSYATSDLFIEHPKKPGYWKVYGRTDDQIMHNTGEKTNPGPLENMLNQDPHVQSSVMFGRGQFQVGVLVDPKAVFKFDPTDEVQLAEFRNMIWPTVQKMNAFAPQHSRLFKEMILICKPSKPFQYTAKNTTRRQVIINNYEQEIKDLYNTVADSAQADTIPSPTGSQWDFDATLGFVRTVVNKVLARGIPEDTSDIFQFGCDSLQATWVRNTLFRALRASVAKIDTRTLAEDFVYQHPTIYSMASFLYELVNGTNRADLESGDRVEGHTARAAAMLAMVAKYTRFEIIDVFPERHNDLGGMKIDGAAVLVTGTTGALGSYLLAELVRRPEIRIVYAINRVRPGGNNNPRLLAERQEKALSERGLNPNIIHSKNVVLLETDLSRPRLGLADDVYDELCSNVTHIIHNAWPVDFKLSLASFETNIKGLRNLIDFALGSPLEAAPKLIYTSSIGVFQNADPIGGPIRPLGEVPIAPEVAIGTGYSESKWVSEEILMHFSNTNRLKSIIARIGQLSGSRVNGYWNVAEWVPALVKSSQALGCLPTDNRTVNWIPLDMAANALVDFIQGGYGKKTTKSVTPSIIAHIIHPNAAAWSTLASIMAGDLEIQLVSFQYWMNKLEAAAENIDRESNEVHTEIQALRDNPALRLLEFFRSLSANAKDSGTNAFGFYNLAYDNAVLLSPMLSLSGEGTSSKRLSINDVKGWLNYWREVGFLHSREN